MASRLAMESAELAHLIGARGMEDRRRVAEFMVGRVVGQFADPELLLPADDDGLAALIEDLEEHSDERDNFRRARAAARATLLDRGGLSERARSKRDCSNRAKR